MEIKCKNNDGQAVLTMNGRLDTSATLKAKEDIERLLAECGTIKELTCDVQDLTYISSSGLRILLALAKRYKSFKVTEAQPEVYQVFDMTGFTKIMKVEKALRQMCIDGCPEIGRGGVGIVYRIDEDTIIKVFREGTSIDEVQTEITMAKEAFVLGMPTAISFDIVKVGKQYGLVYELLNAQTLTNCMVNQPEKIDHFARLWAQLFRQLHDIRVPHDSSIPNALDKMKESVMAIGKYFDEEDIDMLMKIVEYIPQGKALLHCDLQTKNAMMQGDELMLIDMGEVGYGHPVIDLAFSYSPMVSLVGDYQQIIGMTRERGSEAWFKMIHYYFEGLDEEIINHRIEQIETVAAVRNFSWMSLSDSFPQELVDECRQIFKQRVTDNFEHLINIAKTLSDWTT